VTAAAPVVLYTRTGCPYCEAKRRELAARGVAWREINVTDRPQALVELLKLTGGRRIVPVVVEGARIDVAPAGGSTF
jgi:glutaredoxin 3